MNPYIVYDLEVILRNTNRNFNDIKFQLSNHITTTKPSKTIHFLSSIFEIVKNYKKSLSQEDYHNKLLEICNFLFSLKQYHIIISTCLHEYFRHVNLEDPHVPLENSLTLVDEDASFIYFAKFLIFYIQCTFEITKSEDREMVNPNSSDLLKSCLHYLHSMITRVAEFEEFEVITYNCSTLIYHIGKHLLFSNSTSIALPFIASTVDVFDDPSTKLKEINFLFWKALLNFLLCQCYIDVNMESSIEKQANKVILMGNHLSNLYKISSTPVTTEILETFKKSYITTKTILFRHLVFESRRKNRGYLKPKTISNTRDISNFMWPRNKTEKLINEMFEGSSARILAIIESLVVRKRRLLETGPLGTEFESDVLEVTNELFEASRFILFGSPSKKQEMSCISSGDKSIVDYAFESQGVVTLETLFELAKVAYNLENFEYFEELMETVKSELLKIEGEKLYIGHVLDILASVKIFNETSNQRKISSEISGDLIERILDSTLKLAKLKINEYVDLISDATFLVCDVALSYFRKIQKDFKEKTKTSANNKTMIFYKILKNVYEVFSHVDIAKNNILQQYEVCVRYYSLLSLNFSQIIQSNPSMAFENLIEAGNVILLALRTLNEKRRIILVGMNFNSKFIKNCDDNPNQVEEMKYDFSLLGELHSELLLYLAETILKIEDFRGKFAETHSNEIDFLLKKLERNDYENYKLFKIAKIIKNKSAATEQNFKKAASMLQKYSLKTAFTKNAGKPDFLSAPEVYFIGEDQIWLMVNKVHFIEHAHHLRIFGKQVERERNMVFISDYGLNGLDKHITPISPAVIKVTGLSCGLAYSFALGAYDDNGELINGRLGKQTRPVYAAYESSLLPLWNILSKKCYELGFYITAETNSNIIVNYFVSDKEGRLNFDLIRKSTPFALQILLTNMLTTSEVKERQNKTKIWEIQSNFINFEKYKYILDHGALLQSILNIAVYLEEYTTILEIIVKIYSNYSPFIYGSHHHPHVVEDLKKCVVILVELPKRAVSVKMLTNNSLMQIVSSMSLYLIKNFIFFGQKEVQNSIYQLSRTILINFGEIVNKKSDPTENQYLNQIDNVFTSCQDGKIIKKQFSSIDAQLNGNEDIPTVYARIICHPIRTVAKEINLFKKNPRYLEIVCKYLEKALKEKEFKVSLELISDTKIFINRRYNPKENINQNTIAPKNIGKIQELIKNTNQSKFNAIARGFQKICLSALKQKKFILRKRFEFENPWKIKLYFYDGQSIMESMMSKYSNFMEQKQEMLPGKWFWSFESSYIILDNAEKQPGKDAKSQNEANYLNSQLNKAFLAFRRSIVLAERWNQQISLINCAKSLYNYLDIAEHILTNHQNENSKEVINSTLKSLYIISDGLLNYFHGNINYMSLYQMAEVIEINVEEYKTNSWFKKFIMKIIGIFYRFKKYEYTISLCFKLSTYICDRAILAILPLALHCIRIVAGSEATVEMKIIKLYNEDFIHYVSGKIARLIKNDEKSLSAYTQAKQSFSYYLMNLHKIRIDHKLSKFGLLRINGSLNVDKCDVIANYTTAVNELTKAKLWIHGSYACWELGLFYLHIGEKRKCYDAWVDGLFMMFYRKNAKSQKNVISKVEELSNHISFNPKCQLSEIYNYLMTAQMAINISRYIFTNNIDKQIKYGLLAANIIKSFLSLSCQFPCKYKDYSLLEIGMSHNIFAFTFDGNILSVDLRSLLDSLLWVSHTLYQYEYCDKNLPVLSLLTMFFKNTLQSVQFLTKVRILRCHSLLKLGMISEAICVFKWIIDDYNINKDTLEPIPQYNKFDNTAGFGNSLNLKNIEFLLNNKLIEKNISEIKSQLIPHVLILHSTLLYHLASSIDCFPTSTGPEQANFEEIINQNWETFADTNYSQRITFLYNEITMSNLKYLLLQKGIFIINETIKSLGSAHLDHPELFIKANGLLGRFHSESCSDDTSITIYKETISILFCKDGISSILRPNKSEGIKQTTNKIPPKVTKTIDIFDFDIWRENVICLLDSVVEELAYEFSIEIIKNWVEFTDDVITICKSRHDSVGLCQFLLLKCRLLEKAHYDIGATLSLLRSHFDQTPPELHHSYNFKQLQAAFVCIDTDYNLTFIKHISPQKIDLIIERLEKTISLIEESMEADMEVFNPCFKPLLKLQLRLNSLNLRKLILFSKKGDGLSLIKRNQQNLEKISQTLMAVNNSDFLLQSEVNLEIGYCQRLRSLWDPDYSWNGEKFSLANFQFFNCGMNLNYLKKLYLTLAAAYIASGRGSPEKKQNSLIDSESEDLQLWNIMRAANSLNINENVKTELKNSPQMTQLNLQIFPEKRSVESLFSTSRIELKNITTAHPHIKKMGVTHTKLSQINYLDVLTNLQRISNNHLNYLLKTSSCDENSISIGKCENLSLITPYYSSKTSQKLFFLNSYMMLNNKVYYNLNKRIRQYMIPREAPHNKYGFVLQWYQPTLMGGMFTGEELSEDTIIILSVVLSPGKISKKGQARPPTVTSRHMSTNISFMIDLKEKFLKVKVAYCESLAKSQASPEMKQMANKKWKSFINSQMESICISMNAIDNFFFNREDLQTIADKSVLDRLMSIPSKLIKDGEKIFSKNSENYYDDKDLVTWLTRKVK